MRIFLLAGLLAATFSTSTETLALGTMKNENGDATEMIRLLLEDEQLRQYLPEPSSPSPLKLANETLLEVNPEGLGIDAHSVLAKSPEASEALVVKSIELSNGHATLHFRYAPEGLRGTAVFQYDKQASRWTLTAIEIFET